MTLRTVLLSLQALLAAAEPDDPQDAVVANQVGANMHLIFFLFSRRAAYVYIVVVVSRVLICFSKHFKVVVKVFSLTSILF